MGYAAQWVRPRSGLAPQWISSITEGLIWVAQWVRLRNELEQKSTATQCVKAAQRVSLSQRVSCITEGLIWVAQWVRLCRGLSKIVGTPFDHLSLSILTTPAYTNNMDTFLASKF